MKKAFFLILTFLLFCSTAYGAIYYVDGTNGLDTNSGASLASPWKTTNKANSTLVAGDTVYLRAGTYDVTSYAIAPNNSGSEGKIITYSGYGDEVAIFNGASDVTGISSRGIYLASKSYIKITKLNFRNLNSWGVVSGCNHIEISYCDFGTQRDHWADQVYSGTATNAFSSATVLQFADQGWSNLAGKEVFNITAGSQAFIISGTSTSATTYALWGGKSARREWRNGDFFKITAVVGDAGFLINNNSTHNWIHHNTFHGFGAFTGNDEGYPVKIGVQASTTDHTDNNTFEYNHVYAGGHEVLGVHSCRNCVVRGNYVHNEGWFNDKNYSGVCDSFTNGVCGYRNIESATLSTSVGGQSLWEDNVVGYGAQYGGPHAAIIDGSGYSGGGQTIATSYNIIRYNKYIANALYGARFGDSVGGIANYNRLYNNTFYKNGYDTDTENGYAEYDTGSGSDAYRCGLTSNYAAASVAKVMGNVIKNNLFYDQFAEKKYNVEVKYYPAIYLVDSTIRDAQTISNNYADTKSYLPSTSGPFTGASDPLFTSATLPSNSAAVIAAWSGYSVTTPDLSLRSSSPAVNGGTYLTQANGSGSSSTTLVVGDASYFQDGTWGSSLATLNADWIAIGTVSDTVQISSINYSTNTITLASPMTWSKGAGIWLYKDSTGRQVLYGGAPDYGANELAEEGGQLLEVPGTNFPGSPSLLRTE